MKKIHLFLFVFITSATMFGQSLGYRDLGILFSEEDYNGTARFNAMSGAFGALGGDVSAQYLNPASGAVFNKSKASGTMSFSKFNTNATYYNTTTANETDSFRVPQVGMVIVFDSPANASWSKFAFGFNYNMTNDYTNNYRIQGNNGTYARYNIHPLDQNDPQIPYNNPEYQTFTNELEGKQEVYTFTLSSSYENSFYIGAALNFHETRFFQNAYFTEQNTDDQDFVLNTDYYQYLSEISTGVSLGVGVIMKPIKNVRTGLVYQSPVWNYDIFEESNAIDYDQSNTYSDFKEQGELTIYSDEEGLYFNTPYDYPELLAYQYAMNTPEKFTGSFALTFNQHGLISVDFSQQHYGNILLKETYDFVDENEQILNTLSKVRTLRVGSELRFNQLSLRGGAFVSESPFLVDENVNYNKGISLGVGFQLKNINLDFAYQRNQYNRNYDIYNELEAVNPAELEYTNSRISSTLSFSF